VLQLDERLFVAVPSIRARPSDRINHRPDPLGRSVQLVDRVLVARERQPHDCTR
jgi:hypothetical protein